MWHTLQSKWVREVALWGKWTNSCGSLISRNNEPVLDLHSLLCSPIHRHLLWRCSLGMTCFTSAKECTRGIIYEIDTILYKEPQQSQSHSVRRTEFKVHTGFLLLNLASPKHGLQDFFALMSCVPHFCWSQPRYCTLNLNSKMFQKYN